MAAVTVDKLAALSCDPASLVAVIGPSAGPERYEVDAERAAAFSDITDELGPVTREVENKQGKFLLDLWRANRSAMLSAGMKSKNISIAGLCTITYHEYFYSHRVQGNERGSLAGFIMLK
jgi:polyphenol oxidase